MRDNVEAHASLVLALRNIPRGEAGVGGGEHIVPGAGIIKPSTIGLEIHGRELPNLAAVFGALFLASPTSVAVLLTNLGMLADYIRSGALLHLAEAEEQD